jgi:NADH-quinone oxidoreductase subunit A
MSSLESARMKFDIFYYLIGILYLIFDLEILFLFPLGSILFSLNNLFALWMGWVFLVILTIGFIYEWFQGALDIT